MTSHRRSGWLLLAMPCLSLALTPNRGASQEAVAPQPAAVDATHASTPSLDELALVAPADVGLSRERLDRLTRVMRGYVDHGEVPGVVWLVARRGHVAHVRGHRHAGR